MVLYLGVTLHIFLGTGRCHQEGCQFCDFDIGDSINFHEFGISNSIDFHDLGVKNKKIYAFVPNICIYTILEKLVQGMVMFLNLGCHAPQPKSGLGNTLVLVCAKDCIIC